MIQIDDTAPDFSARAFYRGKICDITLRDYREKWVVLFFYPADFTFVCPTELTDLADRHEEFQEIGADILSVSTDTVHVHKAWHESSDAIAQIRYPMLEDPAHQICRSYGTLIDNEGVARRATIIIDPDGVIRAYEFHNNDIGRSTDEIIRKVRAAKFVRENNGRLCPMNWEPGSDAIEQ